MNDLDSMLEQLANAPTPSRLLTSDGELMARVAHRRAAQIQARSLGAAALVALIVGVAGGTLPSGSAAAPNVDLTLSALAPSNLLALDR